MDEVREADLLVHILDISHPNFDDHFRVVNETLSEIDKTDKPVIVVFNKIDAYKYEQKEEDDLSPMETINYSLEDLKKSWMAKLNETQCVFISAQEKQNISDLKKVLYDQVKEIFQIRYPYHNFLY